MHNVGGLLQASEDVRASLTNFKLKDCFPPNTDIREVDEDSLAVVAQYIKEANGMNEMAIPSPPHKKAKITLNPHCGRPLHLAKVKRNPKARSEGDGSRGY